MTLSIPSAVKRVLCIGAHCDDVEIGCGATLATLAATRPDIELTIAVFGSDDVRAAETRAALGSLLGAARWRLEVGTFRESYFPAQWAEIKDRFATLRDARPDLVLTHGRDDLHQDHRVLAELTWNAFRDHWILEYEIPKYDGDLGRPNLYVPLDPGAVKQKIDILLRCFASQASKPWFTAETFRGLMRLRGVECQAPGGYAEAFYARKLVLAP
jgi:LmbE family N-acetylglucosaminyl deacetylase